MVPGFAYTGLVVASRPLSDPRILPEWPARPGRPSILGRSPCPLTEALGSDSVQGRPRGPVAAFGFSPTPSERSPP